MVSAQTVATPKIVVFVQTMSHIVSEKKKLIDRIRRIKGQLDAVERSIEEESDCSKTMHSLTACRGAINALIAEVIEDHVMYHVADPAQDPRSSQARAIKELITVMKASLK
jgi:DNA-binding FrmR family transcriptional regulator